MQGIMDLGQSLLSGGLLDNLSRFVGGSSEATKKTFGAALPASLYAIADHGSTESGASNLLDGLRSGQAPQLDLGDMGRTLADPRASDQLMVSSGGFLERLLGGKLSGLLDGLSSFGGLGRGASSKVMALAAPLAMGLIGQRVHEGDLDARGLSSFLRDQKSSVANLVPGPLRSLLGLPATTERFEREVAPIREEVRPAHVTNKHKRSLWPFVLAGVAALAALIWFIGRPRRRDMEPQARAPEIKAPVTPPVIERGPAPEEREPVAGTKPQLVFVSKSPAVLEISEYFKGPDMAAKRVTLVGIDFASGSSRLDPEGARVAEDLATLMKANPNAKLKIEGYADARGDAAANKQLAQARADELERQLIEKGVADERIEAASMGEERPVAPNETAKGRAENRRMEIVVSKR